MAAPIIYCWDEETKIYSYSFEAQLDPLETEKAGYEIYAGLPSNGTFSVPLEEKTGYDVVWDDKKTKWKYQKQEITPKPQPYEPTDLDIAIQELCEAKHNLDSTDYRTLKYIDGLYTAEEYEVYKKEREELRKKVRDAQKKVDDLTPKNE